MKRKNIGLFFVACLLFTSTTSGTISAVATSTEPKPLASSTADLKTRVEERRKTVQTKLTTAESTQVKTRCTAAQAKVKALQGKLTDNYTPYQSKYDAYSKRLADVTAKLEAGGKDVTELKAQTAVLAQKYAAFKASLDQLTVSVADLAAMDCKADPAGFKATLEATRSQLKATKAAFKDTNSYAKDTIRPTLQKLKG